MGRITLVVLSFFLLACNANEDNPIEKNEVESEGAKDSVLTESTIEWCMYDYCCTGVPVTMDRKLIFKGKEVKYYQGDSLVYTDTIGKDYYSHNFVHVFELKNRSKIQLIQNDSSQTVTHSRFREADTESFKLCK